MAQQAHGVPGQDDGVASPARAPRCDGPARARGEVLVVDDEPAVVALLLDCLALAGYGRTGAHSSAEALERLRSRAFDVMLIDLMMPEMSGIELMVKARLGAPDMAIILVTAVADTDTAVRAMRLGAYDYMVKPVSPGDVVLRVSSAMETRRRVMENRRAQERLEQSHQQLERLAEVKDNLVQMLVHDLKTPLASAMGYMELLERKGTESFSERQLRYLQHAYASCRGVLRMTTTLLDVSRLEHGSAHLRCSPVDLPGLLSDAVAEIQPLVEAAGGRIEMACDPAIAQPHADAESVRRILSNLLANAAKHTPPGSRVLLSAEADPGGFVTVSVADSGPGIPKEDHERIFEKFYQSEASARAGGAGIGLAFCKMAVEAHGGRIWVASTPGQGSTFRFSLPTEPPAGPTRCAPPQETRDEDDPRGR